MMLNENLTDAMSSLRKQGSSIHGKIKSILSKEDSCFRRSDRKKGFTLIELSIVLVIIGLIVGGVLVGRDLIHAAEIRSQISQFQQINLAVNTFRLKYDAIPGDIKNGIELGLQTSNGNGDRIIYSNEVNDVFGALNSAGLIGSIVSNATITTVLSKSSELAIHGVYDVSKNHIAFVSTNDSDLAPLSGEAIAGQDAYRLDLKIDDGMPYTGSVLLIGLNTDIGGSDGLYNGVNDDGLYPDYYGLDADCATDTYTNTAATYIATGTSADCPILVELGR